MAFSYNGKNLPRISDWASAKRIFDKAVPLGPRGLNKLTGGSNRGLTEDTRYLETYGDFKRKPHINIREGKGGELILRMHATDVVTYFTNGDVALEPYDSVSTRGFLGQVGPIGMRFFLGCQVRHGHDPERTYVWGGDDPLRFAWDAVTRGWFYVSGARPTKRRVVDKDKLKELRAALRPFMDWAEAVMTLTGGDAPLCLSDVEDRPANFVDVPMELLRRVQAQEIDAYPKLLAYCRASMHVMRVSAADLAKLEKRLCKQLRYVLTEEIPIGKKPKKDLV